MHYIPLRTINENVDI